MMTTAAIRSEVHHMIDELDDSFLKVIHAMVLTYHQEKEEAIIGYAINGDPIYADAAKIEYAKRVEAMKNGQSTSIEDLKKEAAKW